MGHDTIMTKRALLSYSRGHFDPSNDPKKHFSASIIAKSLYDALLRAGYEITYIDPTDTINRQIPYDLFVGQPLHWTEIAESSKATVKILFMPTSHPLNRNAQMHKAKKLWGVPREEELLGDDAYALRAFELADHVIQIGNGINIEALVNYGVPRDKIIPMHYGPLSHWVKDVPLAHGPLDTYIHVASELGLRKGLPFLVQKFSLPPFNEKFLTLVGEIRKNENHSHWLIQLAFLKRQNSHVKHYGFIDSISRKYLTTLAQHAWYIFPSVEEGEPGTVLEAMTLGLVPILTRESGIDFTISEDFNDSFDSLLTKTLQIQEKKWQELSAKARHYVEIFHDHHFWEQRLVEIFSSINLGETDLRPTASIILTVHNKEDHIVRLLQTLMTSTRSYPKWDLHVVYDGCTDTSRQTAKEILDKWPVPVYEYETPDVFEVKANNHGLKKARGKYCIILQDDNFIYETDWLEKMLFWLEEHPKVGILGGLAGVNFFHLDSEPQGVGINRSTFELHRRLDPTTNKKLHDNVFEADAVMRGPIILRKELLEKHGYLDETYAPFYNDDMDYCFRLRSLGYAVFCYPINVVNESLTVAKYDNPVKDKFWKDTAEKNQRLFYKRWESDIEKYHELQLHVPKPTYRNASVYTPKNTLQRLHGKLPRISRSKLSSELRGVIRSLFLNVPAPLVRTLVSILRKLGGRAKTFSEKLHIHRFEPKTIPWRMAQGDTTLRLDYPLGPSSRIVHLGKTEPLWENALHANYGCQTHTIHTEAKSVQEVLSEIEQIIENGESKSIDLMVINAAGKEYELLENFIAAGIINRITNLQIKFNEFSPAAHTRMRSIQKILRETHSPTYQYEFVWENWERR